MLTDQQILDNKNRFLELVRGIQREGVDMDRLIAQLEGSDFFDAPASAIYHNSFKGGLCAHSLNVYDSLKKLCVAFYTQTDPVTGERGSIECPYTEDSIRIVSLFHDFDKMNKYACLNKERSIMFSVAADTAEDMIHELLGAYY